jgi:hypothetical protein
VTGSSVNYPEATLVQSDSKDNPQWKQQRYNPHLNVIGCFQRGNDSDLDLGSAGKCTQGRISVTDFICNKDLVSTVYLSYELGLCLIIFSRLGLHVLPHGSVLFVLRWCHRTGEGGHWELPAWLMHTWSLRLMVTLIIIILAVNPLGTYQFVRICALATNKQVCLWDKTRLKPAC